MRTALDPPAGGNAAFSAATATVHRTGEGPVKVSLSDDDPHAAEKTAIAVSAAIVRSVEANVAQGRCQRTSPHRARLTAEKTTVSTRELAGRVENYS